MEKILIVSEDKQENDFLKTLLQEEGYPVSGASGLLQSQMEAAELHERGRAAGV